MPRPKQYASAAQKQAAYRQRLRTQTQTQTVLVDRWHWERLQQRLEELQRALSDAAGRGDPLARQCRAASYDTMLEKLAAAFEQPRQDGQRSQGR